MHVLTSPSADAPLQWVELAGRPLGPRDVRVKVRAIGVNPVDWKMRKGGPLRLAHRFVGPSGPLVVGIDFAGDVIECGAQADLRVGTRVVGATDFSRKQRGSYADEVIVCDDQCAALPDSVSYEDAACIPVPGATAVRAFSLSSVSKIPRGEASILVLGASGGVGLMTVQLAKVMGARVVGVCSTRNVALVKEKGATAIDYTLGDPLEAARTHGPFDLVVHAVGTATYSLAGCRSLLSSHGVVALVVVRPADWLSLLFRGNVRAVLGRPNRANLEPIVAAMVRGEVTTLIEKRLPLSQAEEAHRLSRAGKVVGKLLLLP